MRKFLFFVGVSFCWQASYAFEQLPHEVFTTIILQSDASLALNQASSTMHKYCIAWAQSKDKNFLQDTYDNRRACGIFFVLKNNKKISDFDMVSFATNLFESWSRINLKHHNPGYPNYKFGKALSKSRPWAFQREIYAARGESKVIYFTDIFNFAYNGFPIPIIYRNNTAIPVLHYLVENFKIYGLRGTIKQLLESGINPYFMHNKQTISDFLKQTAEDNDHWRDHACEFNHLFRQYGKDPNDPHVVMYYKSQPLSLEALEEIIKAE